MPMYAIATIPLIRRLPKSVTQIWYADDAAALGSITDLRNWWDDLMNMGPSFGFHVNQAKTWLITKDSCLSNAIATFADTNVNVINTGRPYLGALLGTPEYTNNFVSEKVNQWSSQLQLLSEIAVSQPHAAYAALTHGLSSRWLYLSRTVPNISSYYQQMENIICTVFIPIVRTTTT